MSTKITQAIILAGGKGERLRPLTNDRPKPMVEVGEKPIIQYQIEKLAECGVKFIVISCGYKHEVIEEYFKNGSDYGLQIEYEIEESPLGRGGGIKAAMKHLSDGWQDVIVMNGDILSDVDLDQLVDAHLSNQAIVTDLVVPLKSPYGIVEINDDNQVLGFKEKPVLPYWINGGIYVFNQQIENLLPDIGDHETETFPKLPKEKFRAYKSQDYWRGVDTIKDKTEADREVEEVFN